LFPACPTVNFFATFLTGAEAMLHRILILALTFLAATILHAQNILDIQRGWSRDQVLKMMEGGYRISDTVIIKREFHYDLVIRLAPVTIAGYDGYAALHSDSTGRVTSMYWTRAPWLFFASEDGRWDAFTDWQTWGEPTMEDAQTIYQRLRPVYEQKKYHTVDATLMKVNAPPLSPEERKKFFGGKGWENSEERIIVNDGSRTVGVSKQFYK
jgi:hypothetical protein